MTRAVLECVDEIDEAVLPIGDRFAFSFDFSEAAIEVWQTPPEIFSERGATVGDDAGDHRRAAARQEKEP
jgi:hypothetical protein